MTHPDIFPWAIRIPTVIPGKWIYLRAWTDFGTHAERSWGASWTSVWAGSDHGRIHFPAPTNPIDSCEFEGAGYVEVAAAIDRHFRSLGAEEVPRDEWPAGCYGNGNWPPDRTPFGLNFDEDIRALKIIRGPAPR